MLKYVLILCERSDRETEGGIWRLKDYTQYYYTSAGNYAKTTNITLGRSYI